MEGWSNSGGEESVEKEGVEGMREVEVKVKLIVEMVVEEEVEVVFWRRWQRGDGEVEVIEVQEEEEEMEVVKVNERGRGGRRR